jgi:hypothetical protein
MARFFEGADKGGIGVAFPNEEAEGLFVLAAGGEKERGKKN